MRTLQEHNYHQIDATIIADSISTSGYRITTFVVTFPRIVLAELNTHRAFSRNSASSRAIPFNKMLDSVMKHPFIPIAWQEEHTGMQGTKYITDPERIKDAEFTWLRGRDWAKEQAIILNRQNVTKQLCNRMLEPYMWHTAIITATDFENFFALRAHPDAEIHIAKLAEIMLEEYNASDPVLKEAGEWHIPFGDNLDDNRLFDIADDLAGGCDTDPEEYRRQLDDAVGELKIKVAVARCARVSYMNFEGKDDYEADIKLHDRLALMGHWSPFEHCAMVPETSPKGAVWTGSNLYGWQQYRTMFSNQNKKDNRVISKKR